MLKQGRLSQAEIARQLGVSRTAVSQWARRLKASGARGLRRRTTPGRPPRLSRDQRRILLRILKRGALAAGFRTDRWTLARIQNVIEREFGIDYQVNYVGELLHRWDWSVQQPVGRAIERDDELVEAWLRQDWSRIKKGAALARHHRVFR